MMHDHQQSAYRWFCIKNFVKCSGETKNYQKPLYFNVFNVDKLLF